MKPIVKYDANKGAYIVIGQSAIVYPINHPSDLVSNTCEAQTSKVISHNKETGEFETMNTRYVPDTYPGGHEQQALDEAELEIDAQHCCELCDAGIPKDDNGTHYNPEHVARGVPCTK